MTTLVKRISFQSSKNGFTRTDTVKTVFIAISSFDVFRVHTEELDPCISVVICR